MELLETCVPTIAHSFGPLAIMDSCYRAIESKEGVGPPHSSALFGNRAEVRRAGTVHIIEDDAGVRGSLRWLLESVSLRVLDFHSGEEFLNSFVDAPNSCILTDLRMPGLGGLAVLERLASREIAPPVIMITAFGTVASTARAMRAGALHVLEKPFDNEELLETIQEAFCRDEQRRAEHARRNVVTARLARLTQREREVLDLIVAGRSNKSMARELAVSEKNIEYHRANLYRKMQAENLASLVRMVGAEATHSLT